MKTQLKVPLLDLTAHHAPLREELLRAVQEVFDSGHFINGPQVAAFEEEAAAYCGAKHAVGVSSGSDALIVALMALGVGPGDEVVCPSFTFFATAGAVARVGAKPVFVDSDPESFNVDPSAMAAAITKKTKALIPVHLYGQCADLDPILAAARKAGVPVVEDAAQAIGAQYKGRASGTLGDLGCLSFFPTKNLGALGDAGMVLTNDDQLAAKLKLLRNHGAEPKYYHDVVGGNFRLDALQAAALRVKLRHLEGWHDARRRNAKRYQALFGATSLLKDGLVELPKTTAPAGRRDHIFNQFVVRVQRRDALRAFLSQEGVSTEIYYPVPLHLQKCFAHLGGKPGDCPVAEKAAAETLALPIYPELSEDQQARVVEAVARFYAR